MRFSSDFEPNSDSCDCFLSRAEFQFCRASFVVQCSCRDVQRVPQGQGLKCKIGAM